MRASVLFRYLGVLLVLGTAVIGASAQGTRRPKPLATPPVLTGAEIISRAGEIDEPVQNVDPLVTAVRNAEKAAARTTPNNRARLNARLSKLEAEKKVDPMEQRKALQLNLEILRSAEQRSEGLRKQLFEMTEKENTLRARLEQIEFDIRPEMIERQLQAQGSMKPEEIRDNRRKSLDAERRNLNSMLTEVTSAKNNIALNLQRADQMVEKLRLRIEKDIDDSLADPPVPNPDNLEED